MILHAVVRLLGRPFVDAAPPDLGADAIVVLGSLVHPDGTLSESGEERVRAGVALWKRGVAPLLVMTGGFPAWMTEAPPATEAHAMARRARALGVPDEALRVEEASRSTFDNARRCAELLQPAGIRSVRIVTQPFHLRRSVRQFRRAGFEAHGWEIRDSLQYRRPALGLRWVLLEYLSWAKMLARER